MKKEEIIFGPEDYVIFDKELEKDFPREVFEMEKISDATNSTKSVSNKMKDFDILLADLNKQVVSADGCVANLISRREEIDKQKSKLAADRRELDDDRFQFQQDMKAEHQKLEDLKIDFEQEKTKAFNEIASAREELNKRKAEFEKFRIDQIETIENNKKALASNYDQFDKIVKNFTSKLESHEGGK